MSRLCIWCLALAVAYWITGCGIPTPRRDSGADAPTPTDDLAPEDTPVPTDTAPPACDPGQGRCGDVCIDLQTNSANCGTCGTTCPIGQVCRAGACGAEMTCAAGQTLCDARCINPSTDTAHCGACGNACAPGELCQGGACRASLCPRGQTACSGGCVDVMTDATNCGACGNTCPAGQSCAAGACRSAMTCPAGQTACSGGCVNVMTDATNCGVCGSTCPTTQSCVAGICQTVTCPAGQTSCGGACVNTATSTAHCGVCGRTCAAGQTCAAGTCTGTAMCPVGQSLCGTVCANVQTDPAHCGACGNACALDQTCQTGACRASRPTCPAGQIDCAPTAATPTCVNPLTDSANCGACGAACVLRSSCQGGACRCPVGQTLCGRVCVDLQTSANHCGRCGAACAADRVCSAGVCGCAPGSTLCGGSCVTTATDNANCGACGTTCSGGQSCVAGRCVCSAGQTLCGLGTTTVCVSTQTNRANCGACGVACAAGLSCVAGRCDCAAGQTRCGAGATAVCADLQTSASHCGACATVCPLGVPCVAGACRGRPPANDTRPLATVINLLAGNAQSLTADTTSARHDTQGTCACTNAGNDVFFRFVLTQPEMVYADTLGATWDTALFFQDASGNNLTPTSPGQVTCNDDVGNGGHCLSVSSLASQIVARLTPGTYYLVLGGCGAGPATIHFQHLPAGNGPAALISPSSILQQVSGTTSGTGQVASGCCSGGPENAYWWVTCPGSTAKTFYASSCAQDSGVNLANYDVELAQYSALRATGVSVCNDDALFVCGAGASITSTLGATSATQGGLNTLIVDSCGASAGRYTVHVVLASCSSGSRCGAACVDTNIDESHCGGCDRRCAVGQTCVRGVCESVRPGETRDNPIPIVGDAFGASLDTSVFRNDTAGLCGCTAGNDVFYAFSVAQPEIVYADTSGSSYDTSLFLQTAAGVNVTSAGGLAEGTPCNDDGGLLGCATGSQSQILAQLVPGSYLLVVSGCGAGGAAQVHFQRLPVGNGAVRALRPGSSVVSGTTAGSGRVSNTTCCSAGPEDTFYWYTCPNSGGGAFAASTCGRAAWDTELAQVSPGRATALSCNDDACGPRQSTLSAVQIPRGAGLHALYIDGCGASAGAYTASITRP